MKPVLGWFVVLLLTASLSAQTKTAASGHKTSTTPPPSTARELLELKKAIAAQEHLLVTQQQMLATQQQQMSAQQQQIQELKNEMQKREAAMEQATGKADQAASLASQQQQTVSAVSSDVSDLKQNVTNVALSLQETQTNLDSPLALHFKGITITPGGFMAAETVWRSHALGADINTPFNSVPFSGATASRMSEFFGSGRQSRVSMLAQGRLGMAALSGYLETDFLSAGVTSNNNQSNSYALRQRQAWAQAALDNGWTFTGGQMWSLVTETKKGVDNRTEAVPMVIDPQYNVGFSWARQFGFRVSKKFGEDLWWAASVENSQATLGGHLAPGQNNFVIGSQGNGGGLYNPTANYSFNPSPDLITKVAYEPGHWGHFEAFGILSDFRDRIFPCGGVITATNGVLPPPVPCGAGNIPNASGAFNNSRLGWGAGVNARVTTLQKHIDVGIHAMAGDGIGRYGTAGLADTVARPDGVLVPVRNYQALATLEWHSKRLDVYANVGGEYEARTAFLIGGKGAGYGSTLFNNSGCNVEVAPSSTAINVDTPVSTTSTSPVGSGTVPNPGSAGTPLTPGFNPGNPANCTGDTRSILEGSIGFWYRFYRGPKGTLQWGIQYSYIDRNTWAGTGGNFVTTGSLLTNPNALDNLVLTSFRYYLP